MLLKLSSSTCSLCEETDVSLSEADTVQYIRFIKDKLRNDIKLDNGMQFRICLLCSHSLDLLKQVVTRKENQIVKSCFCCKATVNLFNQNDLPSSHKTNINSFASIFNLQGRNICIHCFYAINFWVKLRSFLKSAKQTSDHSKRNSSSQSPTKSTNDKKYISPRTTPSKFNKERSGTFQMPRNAHKFPEIKQQAKTIKLLQGKINRKIVRKYSYDKKLVDRVPIVFVTRIPQSDDAVLTISDDSTAEEDSPVIIRTSRSKKKVNFNAVTSKTTRAINNTPTTKKSFRDDTQDSSDSEDSDTSTPVRNFKSRPLRVIISPLKKKQSASPMKKKKDAAKMNKISSNKNLKSSYKNKEKTQDSDESAESDENDYSVTSSGSSTGIVIKRISRSHKSKPKARKLVASALRTIRIQTKKANTSSSSESTDVSTTVATPRSPVTLPPKKNRKRIMDLSDIDYFLSSPIPEKRSTRAAKDKKRLEKDIEEVIIDSAQEDVAPDSPKGRRQRTKGGKKIAGEKDPLEIASSSQDEEEASNNLLDTEESLASTPEKELISKPPSPEKNDKAQKDGSTKPGFKRKWAKSQDTSDVEESTKSDSENNSKNEDDTAATEPSIDNLISKYIDVDKSQSRDSSTEDITADRSKEGEATLAPPDNETNTELAEKEEEANSEAAGTEQIRFETSLISAPANRAVDTLDLLAVLNDENTSEEMPTTKEADEATQETELNLQLSPAVPKTSSVNDTESTVLISNDEDIYTQVSVYVEDSEEVITKVSSQSSNYQDADDTVPTNDNVVTDLQDNGSLITDDEADECSSSKRKRNAEDSMDSTDADETPRTKRVRFAAEKKVLNEDDTVYLEHVDGSEEQAQVHEGETQEIAGETLENEEEVANDSEALCSLNM